VCMRTISFYARTCCYIFTQHTATRDVLANVNGNVMLHMSCYICHVTYVMLHMSCYICRVTYVMLHMSCYICRVTYVMFVCTASMLVTYVILHESFCGP
jgi:hypothetical protein